MAIARKIPEIIDKPMMFCAGCGHGIVIRLLTEILEEMGEDKNIIFGLGVGCSSLLGGGLSTDRLHCAHGRASAVCTGIKRVNKDNMVIAYQGDGDAYSIGIAESMNAAYRNENFTVVTINNTNFGMTGGQMSWTTLEGQKTSTSPLGRNVSVTGLPIKFPEMIASQFDVAYVARGTVTTPANINKLKSYLRNALEAQKNNEGYSLVEVLSPCPTNWGLKPMKAMDKINEELLKVYPLGILKERKVK